MASAIDKLQAEQRKTLEDTAAAIHKLFQSEVHEFVLKSPEKLTVSRAGAFSKRPYIGDERFQGDGAYVGKSGKVIMKFKDLADRTTIMEMPLNESLTKLSGMSEFSRRLQEYREDKAMGESRKVAEEFEHMAHVEAERARHTDNPVFGSW